MIYDPPGFVRAWSSGWRGVHPRPYGHPGKRHHFALGINAQRTLCGLEIGGRPDCPLDTVSHGYSPKMPLLLCGRCRARYRKLEGHAA